MKFLNILCILLSVHWAVQANNPYPFYNEKEGVSIYLDNKGKKAVNNFKSFLRDNQIAIKEIDQLLTRHFKFVPSTITSICEVDLATNLAKDARTIHPSLANTYLKDILLYARGLNLLDDVAMYPLMLACDVINKIVYHQSARENISVYTPSTLIEASNIIKQELEKPTPILVDWRTIRGQLITKFIGPSKNFPSLQNLLTTLYQTNHLNEVDYSLTKKLAASEAHLYAYNLSDYYQHRQLYPAKQIGYACLVARRVTKKSEFSHRQVFFQKYNNPKYKKLQIKALAGLLEQFSHTLYESKVEINVTNTATGNIDTIAISPIEQYNFAIKQLRKSIVELEQRYYFYKDNKQIAYMDVIIAAFELGTLPADLLEEVAGIEATWKPEQKKSEKIKKWINRVGSLGSTFLPPPFNLITSTGLIVIESLSNNKTEKNEKVHNLF